MALRDAEPAIRPGETLRSIGERVGEIALVHPSGKRWWIAFAGAGLLVGLFALTLGYLLYVGVGIWGNNNAVVWALDIASYDWWIGVACGSLLVSGILLLLEAEWRGAVNRIAETVALLATAAAGLYPIIHLGRPWFFYWNLPYPNTFDLWPQFRSPLLWDAIDIVSFLVVAVSLWYIGLLPDIAALRDRAHAEATRQAEEVAPTRTMARLRAQTYGVLASGWRGSAAHWQIWGQAYRIVALLGVLLVVSVQTGASVMLAGSVMPGWHGTLMPVSFLIHAVLSGVGVTAAILVLVRGVYRLDAVITGRHLDAWRPPRAASSPAAPAPIATPPRSSTRCSPATPPGGPCSCAGWRAGTRWPSGWRCSASSCRRNCSGRRGYGARPRPWRRPGSSWRRAPTPTT